MDTPFKGGLKITQQFGVNASYYKQFGLAGHEGIDCVPVDSDWDLYAIEDGTVVRDIDNAGSGGAYGITVVILSRSRAWWYCHLTENYVKAGQTVKRGDKIGKMGSTGNSSGPHLHLGLRLADDQGNAINTNNGYQGFVDPLRVLEQINFQETNQPMNAEDQKYADEFRKLMAYKSFYEYAERVIKDLQDHEQTEKELRLEIDQKSNVITNLNQQINDRNNDITKLQASISTLEAQVQELVTQRDLALEQAKQVPSLKEQIEFLESGKDYISDKEKIYKDRIKELEQTSYLTAPISAIAKSVFYKLMDFIHGK